MSEQASMAWFFQERQREEAVSRILLLPQTGQRVAVLAAAAGQGKTRILQQVALELRGAACDAVLVSLAGIGVLGALRRIVAAVSRSQHDALALLKADGLLSDLIAALRGRRSCGGTTLLLLDDLDPAVPEVGVLLQLLMPLADDPSCGLSLVCATTGAVPGLLSEQGALRVSVSSLSAADSESFLRGAMARRKTKEDDLDDESVQLLAAAAEGVPRRLMQICELLQVHAEVWTQVQPSAEDLYELLAHLALPHADRQDRGVALRESA